MSERGKSSLTRGKRKAMPEKLGAISRKPYARILIPEEDGTFAAEVLEFPGCYAQGETPDEALRNLEVAAAEWVSAARKQGIDVPEPTASHGYSGTVSLRLPRSYHRHAVRMASREGVSLNQFLVSAVAARIGAEDFFNRLVAKAGQNTKTMIFDFRFAYQQGTAAIALYPQATAALAYSPESAQSFQFEVGKTAMTLPETVEQPTGVR